MNARTLTLCRALLALVVLSTPLAVSGQVQFYPIGDLPGGGFNSQIRDARLTPGGIVAVGTASRFGAQGDTPIKWTPTTGIVPLANDFPSNSNQSFVAARAISADGNVIGGSTRNAAAGPNRGPALWTNGGATLSRLGFLGGNPAFFPNVGINALSADGSVAYGFTRGGTGPLNTTVAFRYTAAGGMQPIGGLRPDDLAVFSSLHSATTDGSSVAGNSTSEGDALPEIEMQAFRYDYTGVGPTGGVITQLPALPGGAWTYAYTMSSDGQYILGASDAPGVTGGELVRWKADGSVESLGSPGSTSFSNFGGMTDDGQTAVVTTSLGLYLRNPSGWFNLATLVTAAGVDLTGWSNLNVLGMSPDGRLIYGVGAHNGNQEGFILLLPPDFMKALGDTTAPVLDLPADIVVEATSPAGAVVNFTATATDAVDGVVPVVYNIEPGSIFPLGTTTVTVSATDGSDNIATGSFTVTVQDTTAPVFTSLAVTPAFIWPPNHKMVDVQVSATASDAVGPVTINIIGLTSSEPDNGLGDGDTANDTMITGALTARVRAERAGGGMGRVYTILVQATDAASNATTGTVAVTVAKK